MEQHIFLLLGSNQGDKKKNLANAVMAIQNLPSRVHKVSAIYKTAAWGKSDQDDFFNQAVMITCPLKPQTLISRILEIEKELGREREVKWGARTIDIDILFIDDQIIQSESLIIPHPLLHERRFVLTPLVEIAADLVHPIFKKDIETLLIECKDPLSVEKLDF